MNRPTYSRGRRLERLLQAGGAVVDQALSSLGNLVPSVIAARELPTSQLGVFGLCLASYLVITGIGRALTGDALLLAPKAADSGDSGRAVAATAVWLGSIVGLALVTLSLTLGAGDVTWLLVMGVCLPGLLLQDAARLIAFNSQRPGRAVANDGLWLLLVVAGLGVGVTVFGGRLDVTVVVAIWAGSGVLAGLVGMLLVAPGVPHPRLAWEWLQTRKSTVIPLTLDYTLVQLNQQGIVFITTSFVGLTAAGGLRGAQTLLGPLNVVTAGLTVVVVMALRSTWQHGPERMLRRTALVGLGLFIVVVAYVSVVTLIPVSLGEKLLGESFAPAVPLALALGAALAFNASSSAATAGIRVVGRVARGLLLRVVLVPFTLGAVAVGAWLGGAQVALVCQAGGALIASAFWWLTYARTLGSQRRQGAVGRTLRRSGRTDGCRSPRAQESEAESLNVTTSSQGLRC